MIHRRFPFALSVSMAALFAGAAQADAPKVLADIAPVHSLVAQVMEGVGTPDLLLAPGTSPHGYSLRPSEAQTITEAQVIVTVSHLLTPWLEKPLEALGGKAHVIELLDVDGATRLEQRLGATFERHVHAHGADHAGHDDHADHKHEDHAHDDKARDDKAHSDAPVDTHAWLDPRNAALWLTAIAEELAEIDPDNAATYRTNAENHGAELAALEAEITAALPRQAREFIVFHDAYQYFEARFGLSAAGSIAMSDATAPSAARIAELKAKMADLNVGCVFVEPQLNSGVVNALDAGSLRRATIDPLGSDIALGPDHYAATLRAMGQAFAACIGG